MSESYIIEKGGLTEEEAQVLCEEGRKTMRLLPLSVWSNRTLVVRASDNKLAGALRLVELSPKSVELGPLVILPGHRSGDAVRLLIKAAIDEAGDSKIFWVSHHSKANRISQLFPQLQEASGPILFLLLWARIKLLLKFAYCKGIPT